MKRASASVRVRLAELRAVARELWPDRDDATVQSELVATVAALRAAERELKQEGNR